MIALMIHAHPSRRSFAAAMRDTARMALVGQGYEIVESDLYAMNFNPVLSAADFFGCEEDSVFQIALEQRNGYQNDSLSKDILDEIHKVQKADLLVFTFPVFWFSVPAILKGWIDRVFISGPFYGGRRIYGAGGMAGKRAMALFSLGGREHMFGPAGLHGPLETGMLRHFLQGALGYVGLNVLEPFVAYHVPYVSPADRAAILDKLTSELETIEARPQMTMPDLSTFDSTFAPLEKAPAPAP